MREIEPFDPRSDPLGALVENTRAVVEFVEHRCLLQNLSWAWEYRTTSALRLAVLTHLFLQARPSCPSPRFGALRALLTGGLQLEEFLKLRRVVEDFGHIAPLEVQVYVALYLDLDRGIFSTGSFFGQYVESQLGRSHKRVHRVSELYEKGFTLGGSLLGYDPEKWDRLPKNIKAAE